ncbi:unnamed protein product [Bursaphelenchus okinawaensis]|uniref:Large ribosomal subunit protein uL24m n=1 Tax=Bursaphelenchus okinawaensis TaxID=465554 RepID=A0A811JTF2_9BILA|nr:unnamed protein product [Bursaphelenchus okinawaensis]CAG9082530.1 unnamed protein product [Bursaphelenchus okinawaensis]
MWSSKAARAATRKYVDYDYARHMPKRYVDKMKRTVPFKEFDNRLGAPKMTYWKVSPADYVPSSSRPWEGKTAQENQNRALTSTQYQLAAKFLKKLANNTVVVPAEKWTFFPGDTVQVMVGKDKNRQGLVSHVIRETGAVFVDGLHLKLEKSESKHMEEIQNSYRYTMQPLYPVKGEVRLVDPNDSEPCLVEWIEKDDTYIRVSKRTGIEIPLPSQAVVTYEYVNPATYIECVEKDTPMKATLRRTYEPKMSTFEDDVADSLALPKQPPSKPTYWY